MALGCSRSKDTFTSRLYHQMVSKFNPLFNGEQALLKGEQTLADQHKDNFNEILAVFPIGTKEQASSVKPDMDRAIEKATKVIKQHSMMIRSDQKNSFIDDSYMLIGKARYYNREYLEALETFNYILQHFRDSKRYDEAVLWAAKTETALGNNLSAKERFEKIYRSEDLPKDVKAKTFASYAALEMKNGNLMAPFQLLEQAVERTKDKQMKLRWMFIMGQLQARMGNDYKASQLFAEVAKKGPRYELLFQAQLARARSFDVDLQNPKKVFNDLEDMLDDDKNYDNRDQIYFVMAEIAERMDDEALMEEYLKKSIRYSTTNAAQKALSYLKLGNTSFDNKLYPTAAAYYDSSYSNLPPDHKRYPEVERKKQSLAGLVKNLKVIETQDSLLMLANLGTRQRQKKVQDIINKEREAAEEARRQQEILENNQALQTNTPTIAGQGQGGNGIFIMRTCVLEV
ncbi:MAG: hypothetical protein U5L96_01955 [Owenweeksia sp.]|nr:hypothetical protein [Owenweeksia sp.]